MKYVVITLSYDSNYHGLREEKKKRSLERRGKEKRGREEGKERGEGRRGRKEGKEGRGGKEKGEKVFKLIQIKIMKLFLSSSLFLQAIINFFGLLNLEL